MTCSNTPPYYPGSEIELKGTFKDKDGNLVDPSTVTLYIKAPDGTVQSYMPTQASTGVYYYDYAITLAGVYWWRMEGTGAAIAANESSFVVVPSNVI